MRKSFSILEEATLSFSKSIFFPVQPKGFSVSSVEPPPTSAKEVETAKSSSFEHGKSEATDFYLKEVETLRKDYAQRQSELLHSIQNKVDLVLKELDSRLPGLVIKVAEKVLSGIELDGKMVKAMVESMIEEIGCDDDNLDVFLAPQDLKLQKSLGDDAKKVAPAESDDGFASAIAGIFDGIDGDDALLDGYPNVKFFEDPSLQPGDCQVKSRFGLLDGRIATKLKRLEEEMKGD